MRALIAARLAQTLAAEFMTKIEKITFWSDSTAVPHWIHQTSSNYKAFVGNQISEIHIIPSNVETVLEAGTVSGDTCGQVILQQMIIPGDSAL